MAALRSVLVLSLLSGAWPSLLPLEVERLKASVGGYAVMNCHLDFPFGNEIPYHLQWDKDGETIFSWYSGENEPRVADRWGGRLRRTNGPNLGRGSVNVSAVRETDAGLYRCLVTFPNRTPPARNNGTFYRLDVDGGNLIVTPPMNSTVLEGDRAELECAPKSLEWPVQWYRDGVPLETIPELAGRTELGLNGSLIIRNAVSTDLGEYDCRVSGPDGQIQSSSAFLDVQYKAKVVYSPKERYLPFGKSASLDCHFSANPPLTNLRWEKDGFLFDPYNVPGVFYSRNGSLLFNRVDESHEGLYSCTPYNALGSAGPSAAVRVRVQRPPALVARPQPLYVARLGAAVTMPCSPALMVQATLPTVRWTKKDGTDLPDGRYSLDGGNLTISSVSEEDRGIYVCTVSNEADVVNVETELLIENVPPRAPYNLSATPSYDSIHLTWVPGHNGVDVEYNVWYRERAESEWRTMKILSRGVTDATLIGLRPATEYELRVLSQDYIGDGLFSKPIFVRTLDQSTPVDVEDEVTSYTAAVTESAPGIEEVVGSDGVVATAEDSELPVTIRLLEEGALVRWSRTRADRGRCTLRWYAADEPTHRLLLTAATQLDYILVNVVEEGASYWATVQCPASTGGASLHVPAYGRLRGVAAGSAAAALLLAALATALLLARRRNARREKRAR
ncbi:protein borderless [Aricia agestis]|uniref:protein borderless n=1 Tax=Aricia agestis TaxID=91739 RepID=UPI001C20486D|nr:protein borderless [Aricia agestis]XP_041988065.1 protein borderless [Aricia agestis]XP_041988066.1 protein borderless [Aricia agestis]